jgi:hypothetical protein
LGSGFLNRSELEAAFVKDKKQDGTLRRCAAEGGYPGYYRFSPTFTSPAITGILSRGTSARSRVAER